MRVVEELVQGSVASSMELLRALERPPVQYPILFQYQQSDCPSGWPRKKNVVKVVEVSIKQRVGNGVE